MPKLKTHKGAKKRFKITGTGKVRGKSPGLRHGLTKRTRKNKRNKGFANLTITEGKMIKSLMPYS
jgi:large subunit ribosomal protein L35